MTQDWRQNPNLVECFDSCVAMLHGMPVARVTQRDEWIAEVKRRRGELGLSQEGLSLALGRAHTFVGQFEIGMRCGEPRYRRIAAVLGRLEAERAQAAE